MISKLSKMATRCLLKQCDILDDEQELYQYGFFILLSQILYFTIAITIGAIIGIVFESIVFYTAFQFIRRYAGGYHAVTETRCEILSTLSIIASIGIIKLSKIYDFKTILLFITLISMVLIFCFCPLDTPEKPLSEKEIKYFRKISWIILLVISSIIIVSYFLKFNILFTPCCVSLILESILLVAGKIKRVHQEKSVKN